MARWPDIPAHERYSAYREKAATSSGLKCEISDLAWTTTDLASKLLWEHVDWIAFRRLGRERNFHVAELAINLLLPGRLLYLIDSASGLPS